MPTSEALRVAIADDNEDHAYLMQRTVTELGHRVIAIAKCGRELLQVCLDHRPDLVITDIKMPDISGVEAAKQIHQTTPIPIVVVTSHMDEGNVREAEHESIVGFLSKPVRAENLGPVIALLTSKQ